jgi:integrase
MSKHRTGHLFKRGKNFYLRWTLNGKVFSKALRDSEGNPVTTQREADEARIKFMAAFVVADEATALESIAARLEGRKAELTRLESESNPPLPIEKAWSEFLLCANRPDSGEATLRQYRFQWAAFADWINKKHPEIIALRDLGKPIAEEYAAHLNHEALSAGTFNKHMNLVALVLRVLKDKARATANPWSEIQRKRLVPQSRRELTIDELRKICGRAKGELRVLLALGVYTGLRLGDCATLRWAEVDLRRKMIRRIPNKTARRNPKPVTIPIHPALEDMLTKAPTKERGEYVLTGIAEMYTRRVDLVTDLVQRHFHQCKIKTHKPGTGTEGKRAVVEVGFHSLRHTFVSLCRDSNAPLAVVESIVGHSNPSMTRHYTHVGELAAGRAVAALPAVIGQDKPTHNGSETNSHKMLREAHRLAKSISSRNWNQKKSLLLMALEALMRTSGAS